MFGLVIRKWEAAVVGGIFGASLIASAAFATPAPHHNTDNSSESNALGAGFGYGEGGRGGDAEAFGAGFGYGEGGDAEAYSGTLGINANFSELDNELVNGNFIDINNKLRLGIENTAINENLVNSLGVGISVNENTNTLSY